MSKPEDYKGSLKVEHKAEVKPEPPAKKAAEKTTPLTEKDGHVIQTVEVPAHTAEVSLGYSGIEGCAMAAATAWDRVYNKEGGDADFAHSLASFRAHLIYVAEGLYRTGVPSVGDSVPALYEAEVLKIKGEQEAEKAKEQEKAAKAAAK